MSPGRGAAPGEPGAANQTSRNGKPAARNGSRPGSPAAPIPVDTEAEEVAAGYALGDEKSARAIAAIVTEAEFYNPRLGRTFDTAVQLAGVHGERRRSAAVSTATGVPVAELERLLDGRPAIRDLSGRSAWPIREMARRRRAMSFASDIHNQAAEASAEELTNLAESLRAEVAAIADEKQAQEGSS